MLTIILISFYTYAAPLSPESSSGLEEEMEVQDWWVKSYLQEEYLKTFCSTVCMVFDLCSAVLVFDGSAWTHIFCSVNSIIFIIIFAHIHFAVL